MSDSGEHGPPVQSGGLSPRGCCSRGDQWSRGPLEEELCGRRRSPLLGGWRRRKAAAAAVAAAGEDGWLREAELDPVGTGSPGPGGDSGPVPSRSEGLAGMDTLISAGPGREAGFVHTCSECADPVVVERVALCAPGGAAFPGVRRRAVRRRGSRPGQRARGVGSAR
jgi:hypothetical protein